MENIEKFLEYMKKVEERENEEEEKEFYESPLAEHWRRWNEGY